MESNKDIRVSIIGSGNVAYHLTKAIYEGGGSIHQIVARNKKHGKDLADAFGTQWVQDISDMDTCDVVLIAVSDGAIAPVAATIPEGIRSTSIVAHTSGTSSIDRLDSCHHAGIFYPLQTFSKSVALDYSNIPFCLDGSTETIRKLEGLARTISENIYMLDDNQRQHIHLAAVMVNNFTNHIYHLAGSYLDHQDIPHTILTPLIQETVRKIATNTPYDAQTGPARRKDMSTIERHLEKLDPESDIHRIYKSISESIIKTYHENNR